MPKFKGLFAFPHNPSAGDAVYSAVYSGDDKNESASSNEVNHSVEKAEQEPLTITSAATHTFGTTYTATVSGGTTNGKVTYQVTGGTGEGSFTDNVLTITKAGTILFTATMEGNENYNDVTSSEFSLTVNKAYSSIAIYAKTVTYNKTEPPYTASNVVKSGSNGEITFSYYSDSEFKNQVTPPLKAGTYYVAALLKGDDNYTGASSPYAILTVKPKPVTIEGVSVHNKTYDGTNTATINNSGTISGLEAGDEVEIQQGVCSFNDKNANDNIGVTATGFSLIGEDSQNYTLNSQPSVANAKISKKALSVTVPPITIEADKPIPALVVNVTGFVNGENESNLPGFEKPVASTSTEVDTKALGTTPIMISYSGGNPTSNYFFHQADSSTITVVPPVITEQDYSLSRNNNQWQNEPITITPQNGYTQISTDKVNWQDHLVADDGDYDMTFYLRKPNGVITSEKTLHFRIDTVKPTGEIRIHENPFRSFINTISFGIFCKDFVDVDISGDDTLSNITIQYMVCDSEDTSGHTYQEYKGSFRLNDKGPYVIYAKITDEAGNETILRSDGVVVFEYSTPNTSKVTYRKESNDTTTATVNLNGNIINYINVGTEKLTTEQCTINGNKIILAKSYLNSLAVGNYTATVYYTPQGYPYVPTNSNGDVTYNHDIPNTTSFTIEVLPKAPTVDDLIYTPPVNLVYNKEAKHATVTTKPGIYGMGEITVNYYKGNSKLTAPPIDAGTYTVKVDIANGSNYSYANTLTVGTFTITKAEQSAPTSPYAVNTTSLLNKDGRIKGVDSTMEYKKQSDTSWTPVKASEITGLTDGKYLIRYAETKNYSASIAKTVIIERFMGAKETTPTATFKAITKTLSGLEKGQKYRIDHGQWLVIPSKQTVTINKPCTIDIFMPGDGIHTLDSDIQTLVVTKATTPKVTVQDETSSGKNDGRILGVNSTMEYKKDNGSWMAVTGDSIDNLPPGQYYVRIKARDAVLESDAVSLIVKADNPEYRTQTLVNDSKEITLAGNLTNGAILKVTPILNKQGNYNHINIHIEDDKETVIGAFEVSIHNGHYKGTLTLSFKVGTRYNGKTLKIYHRKADGSVDTYTTLCKNGTATITVKELSPFVITVVKEEAKESNNSPNTGEQTSAPITGDHTNIDFWSRMWIVSLFVLLLVTYGKRKYGISNR